MARRIDDGAMPRACLLGGVAIAIVFLAACSRSPLSAASLDPATIPVVDIGFEGQTNTFPSPGGIVPSLLRATLSNPGGQNERSWSASPSMLENIKANAGGYGPLTPRTRTRFSFTLGSRLLNVPLNHASASSPGVQLVAKPWGGTLIVNRPGGDWEVWIEMSVVFDDSLEGVPTRVDATYGFWLHAPRNP